MHYTASGLKYSMSCQEIATQVHFEINGAINNMFKAFPGKQGTAGRTTWQSTSRTPSTR
jgi:hypothetical protein